MESWTDLFEESATTFHENYNVDTNCRSCHIETDPADPTQPGAAFWLITVTDFHNGLETGNVGIIEDGMDTSVEIGKAFDWQITSVSDDPTPTATSPTGNMTVTWTATRNGSPIDPCNSDVNAGPVFAPATAVMDNAPVGSNPATGPYHDGQPNIVRSYMQGNDYILGQATTEPGQPTTVNIVCLRA